jgi:glyoxylase I family protein
MPITGFNHYNLRAPRELLDQLRDFYCDVVGLRQGDRPSFRSFGYWLYAGEKDVLHLSECSPSENRATHTATTFDHAAFTCDNAAFMEARLNQHQISFQVRLVEQTATRQIFFKDPAGNGVELNCPANSAP